MEENKEELDLEELARMVSGGEGTCPNSFVGPDTEPGPHANPTKPKCSQCGSENYEMRVKSAGHGLITLFYHCDDCGYSYTTTVKIPGK